MLCHQVRYLSRPNLQKIVYEICFNSNSSYVTDRLW